VSLPEHIRMFTPVAGGGTSIRLNYATPDDIRSFNLEYAFITKGILTIKSISTKNGGGAVDSLDAPMAGSGNIVQVAVFLNAGESATILKVNGDTVMENEILVRKNIERSYDDEIDLNNKRIAELNSTEVNDVSDLERRILVATQALRIDSMEYVH